MARMQKQQAVKLTKLKSPTILEAQKWKEALLSAALKICDAENQSDFATVALVKCAKMLCRNEASAYDCARFYLQTYYDGHAVTTFTGWHGDLQNRNHVECRVLSLCLSAAFLQAQIDSAVKGYVDVVIEYNL